MRNPRFSNNRQKPISDKAPRPDQNNVSKNGTKAPHATNESASVTLDTKQIPTIASTNSAGTVGKSVWIKVVSVIAVIGLVAGVAGGVSAVILTRNTTTGEVSTTATVTTTTATTATTTTTVTTSVTTATTTTTTTATTTTTTATTTTTTATTTTTVTTTTTRTTTTTTATTSTTTTTIFGSVMTGVRNYTVHITGNGYHGIQSIRYYAASTIGSTRRIQYPIIYLSGAIFSGSYVNNAWYALHAGCGNSNGVASCTGVCKALGRNFVSLTGTCGSGYAAPVTSYVNPDRCVYTASDSNSAPWVDYGTGSSCGNPMFYCDCT